MRCSCKEEDLLDRGKVQLKEKVYWINRNQKFNFRISSLFIFIVVLIKIVFLDVIKIDSSRFILLSFLYLLGCLISWYIVTDTSKGSYTLLIGTFIAYLFSISFSSTYEGNILALFSEAIRIEVLFLAIGVPIISSTVIRDENPEKHREVIKKLRYYIVFSVSILISLYLILATFKDVSGSHIFWNIIQIDDLTIISILLFLFIGSLFVFAHILFEVINIYLNSKKVIKENLKQAIQERDINSFEKYCDKLSKDDIIVILNDLICENINSIDNSYLDMIGNIIDKYYSVMSNKNIKSLIKQTLKIAIRIGYTSFIGKHFEKLNKTDASFFIDEIIREGYKTADDSWFCGINYILQNYHKIYDKYIDENRRNVTMGLLYDKTNIINTENTLRIREFMKKNYPSVTNMVRV